MARIDVIMPQMGESIAEGTLSKWIKQVGDEVKRDEPMFEISTDKVDAEIPAPSAGTLVEIKVQEGETVPVQTIVAVLETEKSHVGATAAAPAAGPATQPTPLPAEPATATPATAAPTPDAPAPVAASPTPAPVGSAGGGAQAAAPAARGGDGKETDEERLRRLSTPLVRRIAAEHAVDIGEIPGTGYAGRVTKKDILQYLDQRPARIAPPRAPVAAAPSGPVVHPENEAWEGDRVESMSRIRKLTADHMILSRRVSAHVTTFQEVDLTHVARVRAQLKKSYADRGVNLTYLAFIAKATVDMLRKYPMLNATVSGHDIIYRGDVNLGIAVALDWGLIVPVIRRADELSLFGLARTIQDLAERARGKKLQPDEVQRGTFTITNPGVFGSYIGTPIINQPQVGILGVGAIEKRPKVITLDDGQDVIAIRTMCMFAVTYDHRIVDGADAGRFMRDFRTFLEAFPEEGA
jgi:2-oxoglutarate dehydrogenase E2 component (dihydrolipoamide succinyltransferase)